MHSYQFSDFNTVWSLTQNIVIWRRKQAVKIKLKGKSDNIDRTDWRRMDF